MWFSKLKDAMDLGEEMPSSQMLETENNKTIMIVNVPELKYIRYCNYVGRKERIVHVFR